MDFAFKVNDKEYVSSLVLLGSTLKKLANVPANHTLYFKTTEYGDIEIDDEHQLCHYGGQREYYSKQIN